MNMLFKSILIAGGILLAGIVATNVFANPLEDQVRSPAVRLDAFCSGTIVSSERDLKTGNVDTYVLTAKHCTKDSHGEIFPIAIDNYDGLKKQGKTIYDGDLFGESYKSDLALIKLRDHQTYFPNKAVVAPKDINLQFGQEVVVEGYPIGLSRTETTGKLGYLEQQKAFKDISQSQMFYRATPDVVGGSSGSPLYTLDSDGVYKVIGVLTGGYQMGTYINYFTPVDEINDYLDVALPKKAADGKTP